MDATIKAILDTAAGKFVTIDFVKKDGTPRKVNGKMAPLSPSMDGKTQYVNVQLSAKDDGTVQYRNVNVDTITRIAVAGKVFNIERKA